jgi:hypothetical protein
MSESVRLAGVSRNAGYTHSNKPGIHKRIHTDFWLCKAPDTAGIHRDTVRGPSWDTLCIPIGDTRVSQAGRGA